MSTENPKISAYVPRVVFEFFKQYQDERGISMSQATIEIFAHYFGLNLEESAKEFTGGLPGRLLQVEQSLEELKNLYIELTAKVDYIKSTSEPTTSIIVSSVADEKDHQSELLDELKSSILSNKQNHKESKVLNELLSKIESSTTLDEQNLDNSELPSEPLQEIGIDEPQSNLPSELEKINDSVEDKNPHQQLDIFSHIKEKKSSSSDEPLSDTHIKITAKALVSRIGGTEGSLRNKKAELGQEQFAEWSGKKDPDNIKWEVVKENRRLYYSPVGSLTSEVQSKLLKLVEK